MTLQPLVSVRKDLLLQGDDFSGQPYKVFLLEAALPYTWYNVTAANNNLVLSSSADPFRMQLSPSHYNSIPDLLKARNTVFKDKKVKFAAVPQNLKVDVTLPTGFYLEGHLLPLLGWPKNAKIGGAQLEAPKSRTSLVAGRVYTSTSVSWRTRPRAASLSLS